MYFSSDWLNEYWDALDVDDYRFVYMGPTGTWYLLPASLLLPPRPHQLPHVVLRPVHFMGAPHFLASLPLSPPEFCPRPPAGKNQMAPGREALRGCFAQVTVSR